MRLRASLFIVTIFTCSHLGAAEYQSFNSWLTKHASPALVSKLTQHPKYKGREIELTTLGSGGTSKFEVRLIRTLTHNILVAGQNNVRQSTKTQCRERIRGPGLKPALKIGIEVIPTRNGRHEIHIAGMDTDMGTWLSGLSYRWKGRLNTSDRADLKKLASKPDNLPTLSQTAEIIEQSLKRISCAFPHGVDGDILILQNEAGLDTGSSLPSIFTQQLMKGLTRRPGFLITTDRNKAAWQLEGRFLETTEHLRRLVWTLAPIEPGETQHKQPPQTIAELFIRVPNNSHLSLPTKQATPSPGLITQKKPAHTTATTLPTNSHTRINQNPVASNYINPLTKPKFRLLKNSERSKPCLGTQCREIELALAQSAHTIIFSTTPTGLHPLSCNTHTTWRKQGKYRFRLKAAKLHEVVGIYAITTEDADTGQALAKRINSASKRCGGGLTNAHKSTFIEALKGLQNDVKWNAVHLVNKNNGLTKLHPMRRSR